MDSQGFEQLGKLSSLLHVIILRYDNFSSVETNSEVGLHPDPIHPVRVHVSKLNPELRGPPGIFLLRRERGRTALQAAERTAKRAKAERSLREEEARLALLEAQKV